jgi:signal transduction histidine kinase/tetratricopeptide (TPR) repeat protein
MFNPVLQDAVNLCFSKPEEAYLIAESELKKANANFNEFEQFEAKMVMAFSGQFLGKHIESFLFANEALSFFEQKKELKHVGFILNTFGFIYNYFEDHENRLKVNLKSLKIREQINDFDGYVRSLNNTGDTYLKLGKIDLSLKYFKKCLKLNPTENSRLLAVVQSNIGEAYFLKNDLFKSKKIFENCLRLSLSIDFYPIIFNAYLHLARIETIHGHLSKALYYFELSEKNLELFDDNQLEKTQYHQCIATCFEKMNDYESAVFHLKKYYSLDELIKKNREDIKIQNLQFNLKLKELEDQKQDLEKIIKKRTKKLVNTFADLKVKEELYRKVLLKASDAIISFDENGHIIEFNPIAVKKLKVKKGQFIGNFLSFKNELSFEKLLNDLFTNKNNKFQSKVFDMIGIQKEVPKYFDASFNRVFDGKHQIGIVFLHDVSYLVDAEKKQKVELKTEKLINQFSQSLVKANTVNEVLWSVVKNCISKLDFEDCVIYLLDKEKNLLIQHAAYGPKNPKGYDIYNPISIQIGKGIVGTVAKTGKMEMIPDTSLDSRYILDDESRLSEIAVPIILDSEVIGVIDSEHSKKKFFTKNHVRILKNISAVVSNRIDKLREIEVKEQLQNNILKVNESLEEKVLERTSALNISNKEKDKILGILAHDVNNKLGGIASLLDIIQNYQLEAEENKEYLQLASETCMGTIDIIRDLLEYSKNIGEQKELYLEKVNFFEFVSSSVEMYKPKALKKSIKLNVIIPEKELEGHINKLKFSRVIDNLITNAIKFTSENGKIDIGLNDKENEILLSIRDSGIGIPEHLKEGIFTPFSKSGRPGTQNEQSNGLGLSIVKNIVESHKGKIWFESFVGKGTTFYISLPK